MQKSQMRTELDEIIKDIRNVLERSERLRAEMHNRPRVMRGKATSNPITSELRAKIIRAHEISPYTPQHELAKRFGVNPGRISEILAGKRE